MKVLAVIGIFLITCIISIAFYAFVAWLIIGVILPLFSVVITLTFWQYVLIGVAFGLVTSFFRTTVTVKRD